MAVLADLLVRFGADSAELRKTLKTVQSDLSAFRKDVAGITGALRGAFVAVGAERLVSALTDMVVEGVEAADRMGKLAQQSGLAVEEMSGLAYAAELSGVGTEGLAAGLKKLSTEMMSAAGGSKESAAVFRALGVEVMNADGSLRSTSDVLGDVADQFAHMEDGPGKAAIAVALFGRSGAELIPFLNEGSAGLERLSAEAERLGLIIDGETAKSADKLGDNFDRLHMMGKAFSVQLSSELNPMLLRLSDSFIAASAEAGGMHQAATAVAAVMKSIATSAAIAWAAMQLLTNHTASAGVVFDDLKKRIHDIWDGPGGLVGKLTRTGGARPAPIITKTTEAVDETEKSIKSLQNTLTGLDTQVATFGKGDVEVLRFRLEQGDLKDELAAAGPLAAAYKEQILAAAGALVTLKTNAAATDAEIDRLTALVDESRKVIDETRTPAEQYADTVERLGNMLAQGAIDQETYNRAMEKARKQLDDTNSTASDLADAGADAFDSIVQAAREGGDAIEAFWKSLLDSFTAMLRKMLFDWLKAKAAAGLGNAIGNSIDAGGGAGGGFGIPEASPGSGGAKLEPAGSVGGSDKSQVYLSVTTFDAASFDAFLAKNEGVLASRINRIAYKGRT
jgi:uncharacterized phage infection (PIP) family protein YhgE